jgi:hypothetical protein
MQDAGTLALGAGAHLGRVARADVATDLATAPDRGREAMSEALSIQVERRILFIRGQKVLLDADLAELYEVPTKRLNEQVRRNRKRFPEDFVFQLTREEFEGLRSQFATSSLHGGRRYLPFAFTEHGALMAANVLNNARAIRMSVEVVRAFVRLREMLLSNAELARKLDALERKYDEQFRVVFEAIRELMSCEEAPKRRIGFKQDDE